MRKTVRKLFWVWDFEKEEEWLTQMAAKGLALVSVGFCRYEFEECLPGEYTVRLELLENLPTHPESERYIAFLEETGAEHVGSYMRWAYFRKKTADGSFELFSDNESRIKYLTRIIRFIAVIGCFNLFAGAYNLGLYFFLTHMDVNLLGLVNIALGGVCMYGTARLTKKRKRLKEEQQIFE